MAISNLHTLSASDYTARLFNVIAQLEGREPGAYFDSKGIISIGVGFNIDSGNTANRSTVMNAMGLSAAQQQALNAAWSAPGMATVRAMPAGGTKNAALQNYLNGVLAGTRTFDMSDTQMRAAFTTIVAPHEMAINALIATPSMERIALVSMHYNTPALIGSGVRTAVAMADPFEARAEAWYQIRYSHANELHKRRYVEAAVFGLYGSGAPQNDLQQAQGIYRMYSREGRRQTPSNADIVKYDVNLSQPLASAQDELNAMGLSNLRVQAIKEELRPAANALIAEYITKAGISNAPTIDPLNIQVAFDGNEVVGEDTATRTGSNDNFLIGRDGAADTLHGLSGNDVLAGLSGNDTLEGGKGNDLLIGGDGNDTYIFGDANKRAFGADIIKDSDGSGRIVLDGLALSGGKRQSKTIWRSDDDKTEFHFDKDPAGGERGTLRILRTGVVHDGSAITVRDWKPGDLGITLASDSASRSAAPAGNASQDRTLDGERHGPVTTAGGKEFYQWGDPGTYVAEAGFADVFDHFGNFFDNVTASTGGGADAFIGNAGHDSVDTGDGNDLLVGGLGVNTLNSGAGKDIISVLEPNIVFRPSIRRVGPQDHWVAPAGANVITSAATWGAYRDANGQLRFSAGDSGTGADVGVATAPFVLQGDPFDAAYQSWGNDIDAGAGDDMVFGGLGSDSIVLGADNDIAFGFAGHDDIFGGDGNDRIYGDRQTLTVSGLGGLPIQGSITLSVSGDDFIDGGEGDDVIFGDYGNNTLFGGAGNDILVGGFDFSVGDQQEADNRLLNGNDITSQVAEGASDGAKGRDNTNNAGSNYLDGGEGNDLLIGGALADTLLGGGDNDTLFGGLGDDYLDGGSGRNVLHGGGGNDTLVSGSRVDAATSFSASAILIDLGSSILEGGSGDDTYIISADAGDVVIRTRATPGAAAEGAGHDRIVLAGSRDTTNWRAFNNGSDLTVISQGVSGATSVRLEGFFSGGDEVSNALNGGIEFENGGSISFSELTADTTRGTPDADVIYGLVHADGPGDTIDALAGDDEVYTLAGDDVIQGGAGNDLIFSGDGKDVVHGGDDNDVVHGGAGDDALYGGAGDDTLYGGTGMDLLDGGTGNDTYVFDLHDASTMPGQNIDLISDTAGTELIRLGADVEPVNLLALWEAPGLLTLYWGSGAVRLNVSAQDVDRYTVEVGGSRSVLSSFVQGQTAPPSKPGPVPAFDEQANATYLTAIRAGVERDLRVAGAQGLLATASSNLSTALWQSNSGNESFTHLPELKATTVRTPVYQVVSDGFEDSYGQRFDSNGVLVALPAQGSWTVDQAQNFFSERYRVNRVNQSTDTGDGHTVWLADVTDLGLKEVTHRVVTGFSEATTYSQVAYAYELNLGGGANNAHVTAGVVDAGAGNDVISVEAPEAATVNDYARLMSRLTSRNERFLSGDATLSYLNGGDGSDVLIGSTMSDVLYGGAGNNSLYGGTGPDRYLVLAKAEGATGYDYIADTTTYQPQHDDLAAMYGGPADEWIPPGADIDTVEFGPGIRFEQLTFSIKTAATDSIAFLPGQNYDLYASGYRPDNTRYVVVDSGGQRLAAIELASSGVAGAGVEYLEFQDGQKVSLQSVVQAYEGTPVLAQPLPDAQANSSQAFSYDVGPQAFSTPTGQPLTITFSLADGSPLPAWLQVNQVQSNGEMHTVLSGTPDNSALGKFNIRVTASSAGGLHASDDIQLTVASGNHAPVVGELLQAAQALDGQQFVWQFPVTAFSDPDAGDTLTWSFSPDDPATGAWLSFNAATHTLSGTPAYEDLFKTVQGTVTVTDATGATAKQRVEISTGEVPGVELHGTGGDDTLTGTAGNDLLDGGLGNDTLRGGKGNDTYYVDSTLDKVIEKAGEGHDLVVSGLTWTLGANLEDLSLVDGAVDGTGNSLNNMIEGNDAANRLAGGAGDDALYGWGGDDWLRGGTGADIMHGGQGNDLYEVDNVGDQVFESPQEGTDTVEASVTYTLGDNVESLILSGSSAIDGSGNALDNQLQGNDAANTLTGGDGNDILNGKSGADVLIGGMGNDTYIFESDLDKVLENAGGGRDSILSRLSLALPDNVEDGTLLGSATLITGNELSNVLVGNDAGNTLDGGGGADVLLGGKGNDRYIVDNQADTVVEKTAEGTDEVVASVNYTLGDNVENLTLTDNAEAGMGNALNNVMVGNALSNKLFGDAGNDDIDGGGGADILVGGTGNDKYHVDSTNDLVVEVVGEGTDTVYASVSYALADNVENLVLTGSGNINAIGNAGNNRIEGNAGNNVMFGGLGNDTYVFGRGSGQDVVANFDAGKPSGDKVQLGADIVRADIALARRGNDLVLRIQNASDQLTVANYFTNGSKGANALESIRFSDGTSLNPAAVLADAVAESGPSDAQSLSAPVLAGDPNSLFSAPDSAATALIDAPVPPQSVAEAIAAARERFEQGLRAMRASTDEQGSLSRGEFVERRTLPLLWNLQDALLNLQLVKNADGRFSSDISIDSRATRDLGLGVERLGGVAGTTGRLDQVIRPPQVSQFDLAQLH